MSISEYSYALPESLIAQEPLENREASRMLVVKRAENSFADARFADFPTHLRAGDVVVINNTRVFPARLLGSTESGAKVEIFLIREVDKRNWEALARPAKRLKIGKRIGFGKYLEAIVIERLDSGRVVVKFETDDLEELIDAVGKTPLPPYIKRPDFGQDSDRERYQTVFASKRGAIAAPTAGLHFSPAILERIRKLGAVIAEITLHVGYGTFEPVRVDDLSRHKVLPERYEIGKHAAEILNAAKQEGRRIVAIGTTTTRALETNISRHAKFAAENGMADLTITPGHRFGAVDALLTNFHLPESSLLILVSTFGGRELILSAYSYAVRSHYRFYSYGDCMLIV
jgi:S-adenosylmethionine:tRNA ribosyltransferase-isomerase